MLDSVVPVRYQQTQSPEVAARLVVVLNGEAVPVVDEEKVAQMTPRKQASSGGASGNSRDL